MRIYYLIILVYAAVLFPFHVKAQIGMSATPPRLYYEVAPGNIGTAQLSVSNLSRTQSLDIAISLGDWNYDYLGNNMLFPIDSLAQSCASWVTVDGGAYFSLGPGASKELNVRLTVPSDINTNHPIHTAVLYLTQVNPAGDQSNNMRIAVRSAIKLYHRLPGEKIIKINITHLFFEKEKNSLKLDLDNESNVWTEGMIYTTLLNNTTGKEYKLDITALYSLPGDKRTVYIPLPETLDKGKYTATLMIDSGDRDNLEVAELTFTYE